MNLDRVVAASRLFAALGPRARLALRVGVTDQLDRSHQAEARWRGMNPWVAEDHREDARPVFHRGEKLADALLRQKPAESLTTEEAEAAEALAAHKVGRHPRLNRHLVEALGGAAFLRQLITARVRAVDRGRAAPVSPETVWTQRGAAGKPMHADRVAVDAEDAEAARARIVAHPERKHPEARGKVVMPEPEVMEDPAIAREVDREMTRAAWLERERAAVPVREVSRRIVFAREEFVPSKAHRAYMARLRAGLV